jgi:hypothetical protein
VDGDLRGAAGRGGDGPAGVRGHDLLLRRRQGVVLRLVVGDVRLEPGLACGDVVERALGGAACAASARARSAALAGLVGACSVTTSSSCPAWATSCAALVTSSGSAAAVPGRSVRARVAVAPRTSPRPRPRDGVGRWERDREVGVELIDGMP